MHASELKDIIASFRYLAAEAYKAGYPEVREMIEDLICEVNAFERRRRDGHPLPSGTYSPADLRRVIAVLRQALMENTAVAQETLTMLEDWDRERRTMH